MINNVRMFIVVCVLACMLALGALGEAASERSPVFSFWRNLELGSQVHMNLEYRRDAPPLPPELAGSCMGRCLALCAGGGLDME